MEALFQDPALFLTLREAVPRLRTYPSVRLWQIGCGGGEMAYATAIVLREEGLEARATLYATDDDPARVAAAGRGVVPPAGLDAQSYAAPGGRCALCEKFFAAGGPG